MSVPSPFLYLCTSCTAPVCTARFFYLGFKNYFLAMSLAFNKIDDLRPTRSLLDSSTVRSKILLR